MDVSVMQTSMLNNLASLQSAISMTLLDKTMNTASAETAQLLETMPAATPLPPSEHLLDTYA